MSNKANKDNGVLIYEKILCTGYCTFIEQFKLFTKEARHILSKN
jgi:hypothetical protein